MKLVIYSVLIFVIFQILTIESTSETAGDDDSLNGLRWTAVDCVSDNISIAVIHCFVEKPSKQTSILNLENKFPKPLEKPFFISFTMSKSNGTTYLTLFEAKHQDWCSILEGKGADFFLMYIIEEIRKIAPRAQKKCPYVENYQLRLEKNLTIKPPSDTAGNYKVEVEVVKSEKVIFEMNLTYEIK
jgi:hypothetical protein